MYCFKSQKKVLQFQTSTDKCNILNSHLTEIENLNPNLSKLRTGAFDNQGSSQPWTWAWTTDDSSFEVWRPSGIYLRLESNDEITIFNYRKRTLKKPIALSFGKTGLISFGIIGLNSDGKKTSLIKDTYPFFDALMNVTYDGISEDENFHPLLMIGRELASRLQLQFNEGI